MIALLSAAFLSSAWAAPAPSFRYELGIDPARYALTITMTFSEDVGLGQVIANFRNGALLHEFNPDADPIELRNASADGRSYDAVMSWRSFGIRTRQLAHCREIEGSDHGHRAWTRTCETDVKVLDAGKYTDWKRDQVSCRETPGAGPECRLEIGGHIRDYLFMKGSVLTLKAKRQALINWGRFWFLTETGSVSTRFSNPLFDRSQLRRDIEALLDDNLKDAKARAEGFRLKREGSFAGPVVR